MSTTRSILTGVFLALLLGIALGACSNNSAAIDRMVAELNSPEFRAAEAQTGLFTDSEAKVVDSTLKITFICQPAVDLSGVSDDQIPQLRESAIAEFRSNLGNPLLKSGIEALAKSGMTLTMVWKDAHSHNIELTLSPGEILE